MDAVRTLGAVLTLSGYCYCLDTVHMLCGGRACLGVLTLDNHIVCINHNDNDSDVLTYVNLITANIKTVNPS